MGVPGCPPRTHISRQIPRTFGEIASDGNNRGVDPVVFVVIAIIVFPLAVLWALSRSASLRGPAVRSESRKPVEALVTDLIPDDRPEEERAEDDGPGFMIDSEPPDPAEQNDRPAGL